MHLSKEGITKVQAAICAMIIVVAASVGGAVYFLTLSPPSSSSTFKMGVTASLSGEGAPWATPAVEALKMAVEEINNNSGIGGRQIELITYDDASNVNEAIQNSHRLIESDKVDVGFIVSSGDVTEAAAIVWNASKVPEISLMAADPATYEDMPYCFGMSIAAGPAGKVQGWYAINRLNATTMAVIVSDDDFARNQWNGMQPLLAGANVTIVYEHQIPFGELELTPYMTAIKDLNPDAIYLDADYDSFGAGVRQARSLGLNAPILGSASSIVPELIPIAGEEALEAGGGVFFPVMVANDMPKWVNLTTALEARGVSWDPCATPPGYDVTYLLKNIVTDYGFGTDNILRGLNTFTEFGGVVTYLGFTDEGGPIYEQRVVTFKDGAFPTVAIIDDPAIIAP